MSVAAKKMKGETMEMQLSEQIESPFRVDGKRRITLGKLADGIDSYIVSRCSDGRLILEPKVLASPNEVISAETQISIQLAVENAKGGEIGPEFNPNDFRALLDEDDEDDED